MAGRPAALGKPNAGQWETPWYKSAYPYVGAVLLVTAVLYFLGRSNPTMMLACILLAALYTLIIHIVVIVAAFKEGVGTGLLTLFLPFYSFYFVFRVYDGETLKILYTTAALISIALRFLPEPAV